MHTKISKQTRRELLEALHERYRNSAKIDKAKILDEFVALAGCHRKHGQRNEDRYARVNDEERRVGGCTDSLRGCQPPTAIGAMQEDGIAA